MRVFIRCFWPLMFLAAAGCGDTYTDLLNEECALANEFADSLLKVVDGPSADYNQKYVCKKILDKFKGLKNRKDRFNKNNEFDRIPVTDIVLGDRTETVRFSSNRMLFTRLDGGTVKVEIVVESKAVYEDLRTLANPETKKHIRSIASRTDQQLARIEALMTRWKAEKPETDDWALLSWYKDNAASLVPHCFDGLPKIPVPFESFSKAVTIK